MIINLSFIDENIDRLYKKKVQLEEICEYILRGDAYSTDEIIGTFEKDLNKIKKKEEKCEIKISTYILDNYKENQLFYDPYHPTNDLIKEYGRQILSMLGITIDESFSMIKHLDFAELFIYGCVKKALGLRFTQNYIRVYHEEYTLSGQGLSLKECVQEYIAWHFQKKI